MKKTVRLREIRAAFETLASIPQSVTYRRPIPKDGDAEIHDKLYYLIQDLVDALKRHVEQYDKRVQEITREHYAKDSQGQVKYHLDKEGNPVRDWPRIKDEEKLHQALEMAGDEEKEIEFPSLPAQWCMEAHMSPGVLGVLKWMTVNLDVEDRDGNMKKKATANGAAVPV